MPIYEYECEGCAYHFEVKQSIKDAPLTTCERCGKSLRRLISSPGIMFKGSGWYVTDYSNKLKPPSEGEQTPAAAGDQKETPALCHVHETLGHGRVDEHYKVPRKENSHAVHENGDGDDRRQKKYTSERGSEP